MKKLYTPISIIIPVYKTSKVLLQRCLKSIEEQNDTHVEVIIVFDGAPQFEIKQLLSDHQSLLIHYQIVNHAGVSHARNIGLSLAKGGYVMFVDADDALPLGSIEALRKAMQDNQLAVGAFYKIQGNSKELIQPSGDSGERDITVADYRKKVLLPDTGNGLLWNKMYSLNLIIDNKIYFDESLTIAEDSDFVYRYLSAVDKMNITNEPVYMYIRNSGSTVNSFDKEYENKVLKSMEKMRQDVTSVPDLDESYISTYYTFHILLIIVHYIFNPTNGWNSKKRRKEYADLWNVTNKYISKSKKNSFNLSKKIAIWCFRYRLFTLSRIIAWIRNRQIA